MTQFGPGAPCGLTRFVGEGLGRDVQDNFFACLFNLHKVTRHVLEPDGATFLTRDSDFLVSNNVDFHPTDVVEDADGSLVIIDTGGWYKLCCPTSQLAKPDVLGAIYRVRKKDGPRIEDPRGLKLAWETFDARGLAGLLADRRVAVAERAGDRLAKLGEAAVPALASVLETNDPARVRQRALWILARVHTDGAKESVRRAMGDSSVEIRMTAAKIAGLLRDAGATSQLTAMLRDESLQMRRAAAEALGRIADNAAVPALLPANVARASDRFLEHALIYALIQIGDAEGTRAGLAEDRPAWQRRMALIALSEMEGAPLPAASALALIGSSEPKLTETARWVAGRHPEWAAELAAFFRAHYESPEVSAADRAAVENLFAGMLNSSALQQVAATMLSDGSASARSTALRAIARSNVKSVPAEWTKSIATLLRDRGNALLREAVAAANAFVGRKEAAALVEPLLAIARDAAQPDDLRLAALSALPDGALEPDATTFAFLRGRLDLRNPPFARSTAASVLARAKLNDPQRYELIGLIPDLGPLELSRIVPAFDRALSEQVARRLVDALGDKPAVISSQPQAFRSIFSRLPSALRPDADALLAKLEIDPAQQRARLDSIAAELPPGDVRRGQSVFNSTKATCTTCHAVGYLGGKLGPDLTSIGAVRSERDLLEAIVFPSASFVRSYEPMVVRLKSGSDVIGIPRGDSGDTLTLATGPGAEQRVAKAEVAEMQPGTTSLMPQGFDQVLSRQELADLVAFLKACVPKGH
jgi:putative heme-binding domain-containing protein